MERQLVEEAMRGDRGAFDRLVEGIGDRLYAVASRILDDGTLAQDATQRALVNAWRNLPALRNADGFEAWAYRLLVNACHREARNERRHRGAREVTDLDRGAAPDVASRLAIEEQLDRAFRTLSVEHRAIVVLVHYVGLSPAEAAAAMGTPAGTARSRLHYALRHMRAAIEADARLSPEGGEA